MADLEKLDSVIKELVDQSNELKAFNAVYSEIGKIKSDISENLNVLKENNEGFESLSSEIQVNLEQSKKLLENLQSEQLRKIQELYQDNKNFQKDLDSSLASRLEKNKSDIQVEIRNEGSQIQRSLENTLTSSLNQMELKLEARLSEQSKQLNTLKILLFVLIAIGIGLAVGLFFK